MVAAEQGNIREESILLHFGSKAEVPGLSPGKRPKAFNGEFDPGSELTLAECITHASRAKLLEITSTGSLAADECVTRK